MNADWSLNEDSQQVMTLTVTPTIEQRDENPAKCHLRWDEFEGRRGAAPPPGYGKWNDKGWNTAGDTDTGERGHDKFDQNLSGFYGHQDGKPGNPEIKDGATFPKDREVLIWILISSGCDLEGCLDCCVLAWLRWKKVKVAGEVLDIKVADFRVKCGARGASGCKRPEVPDDSMPGVKPFRPIGPFEWTAGPLFDLGKRGDGAKGGSAAPDSPGMAKWP